MLLTTLKDALKIAVNKEATRLNFNFSDETPGVSSVKIKQELSEAYRVTPNSNRINLDSPYISSSRKYLL